MPNAAAPREPPCPLTLILARKVLEGHLANRNQLLTPPPSNLRGVERAEGELLIRAMIAAAHADGAFDADEEARIRKAMELVGLDASGDSAFLDGAMAEPAPLEALLRQVQNPQTAMRVYAAAVMAVDKHRRVNRSFLQYLADRLQLPHDAIARVHRQYGLPS